jgi:hypothetical protein
VQTTVVLHRQQREAFHEHPGKEADTLWPGQALARGDRYALSSAGGRLAFENETAQVLFSQPGIFLIGPGPHLLGQIHAGANRHQSRGRGLAHKAHGFTGHGHTALHFRTDRHELYISAQGVPQKSIQFVSTVVANCVA